MRRLDHRRVDGTSRHEIVSLSLKWEERFNETEGGRVNVAELCRMFGISRQSGYEWIGRDRETGDIASSSTALDDR